jgi:hypothetical protein
VAAQRKRISNKTREVPSSHHRRDLEYWQLLAQTFVIFGEKVKEMETFGGIEALEKAFGARVVIFSAALRNLYYSLIPKSFPACENPTHCQNDCESPLCVIFPGCYSSLKDNS